MWVYVVQEVSVYPVFSLNYAKFHCRHIFLPLLIYRCMILTTANGQQKSIAATNNRTVRQSLMIFFCLSRKYMF